MLRPDPISTLLATPALALEFDNAQWESVVHTLRDARLMGTLHARASSTGVLNYYNPYARRHLQSMRVFADRQAAQARYDCALLQKALDAIDASPVFLKGASYTLANTANNPGRIYSDIDVLVRREDIARAEQQLQLRGYYRSKVSDYDDRYYREWAHEIPPLFNLRRGTVIDLHHNIIPPVSGRSPTGAFLFAQIERLDSGHHVLSREAMVLHSMIHLLINDDLDYAYRDLVDLWQLLSESPDLDWQKLLKLTRETGFEAELWYTTRLLEGRFPGFTVPEAVREALKASDSSLTRHFVVSQILAPALLPADAKLDGPRNRLARGAAYARGHWLKMPLPVLIKHSFSKAWIGLRDWVFGKYQFEKPGSA